MNEKQIPVKICLASSIQYLVILNLTHNHKSSHVMFNLRWGLGGTFQSQF